MCHLRKYHTRIVAPLLLHELTGRAIYSIHSFCGIHWLSFLMSLIPNHFCALHALRTLTRRISKAIHSYQERIIGLMADWRDTCIIHSFFIILTVVFSLLAVCTAVVRATRFSSCHPSILLCFPSSYRFKILFCLFHKSGFTKDALHLVQKLVDEGLSFEQIERLLELQYRDAFSIMELKLIFGGITDWEIHKKFRKTQTRFAFVRFQITYFLIHPMTY